MKFHRSFLPVFNRSLSLFSPRRVSFEIEITKNEAVSLAITLRARTLAGIIKGDGTKGEKGRNRERERRWLYLKFDATKRDE